MPYIGNSPGTGTRNRFIYTATASQTTFSGADDNGKTLKYADSDYVDVYLNGICLVPVTDYTSTSKTSIVLTQAASLNDTLEVVAYDIATISDTVSKADGGTFEDGVTIRTADNTTQLTLESTDADANSGPVLELYRNSSSPADDDVLGEIEFHGENDADEKIQYGLIAAKLQDASDGTEDVRLSFKTITAGTERERVTIQPTEVVINEDSQDLDFRVESDGNANMLFVDAGNNAVGIATNSPRTDSALTVGGTSGDGNPTLAVSSTIEASSPFNYVFSGHITDLPSSKRAALSVGKEESGYNQTIMGHYNSSDGSTSNYGFLGLHNADDVIIFNGQKFVGISASSNQMITPLSVRSISTSQYVCDFAVRTNGYGIYLRNASDSVVGTIIMNASSTTYNTTSDYRLKENVTDITDGITRVKQLSPKRFNFIADTDTTVDGFLAHEAATVVPEAITGTHNEVETWKEHEELPEGVSAGDNKLDDDGNTIPVYQGIDQSKLVPLLTAALQEAIAKIETLETKVAALEAG